MAKSSLTWPARIAPHRALSFDKVFDMYSLLFLWNTQQMQTNVPTVFIRRKEVERRTTLSRSQIYALMQQGLFPKQISLSPMTVAWIESEVQDWIAARIAEYRKSEEQSI